MEDQHHINRFAAAEDELFLIAERNALLQALDSVSQGVVICNEEGAVVYESASVRVWLDLSNDADYGVKALHEVLSISRYGRRNTRSIEILGPPPRSLVINGSPILAADLASMGGVAVLEDTTKGRHHEALMSDFVANVSHELKTPVGALGLLAEALAVEKDPAVIARLLERMHVETTRVTQTIDDLLSLSNVESPSQAPHEVVAVRAVVGQAMAGIRYGAEHRAITIDVQINGEPTLYGSLRHLVSALHHLLENAVKYSTDGTVVNLTVESDGEWTEIELSDYGIGIPVEYLDRIFERFFRVDNARTRATGGTGLGLSIVRQVVQRHGGEVRVTSSEGKGSTFFVRLPAIPAVAIQRRVIRGGEDG